MIDWQKLLLRVEKPSRYMGGELNSYHKKWDKAEVRLALAFPDTYEVGMSHLGMALLYHGVNSREEFIADRVYAPWIDMEKELRRNHFPLLSLDLKRPVGDFDIVGFSLQYELSYTNILTMLDLAGIPLFARHRQKGSWPFIIGGGPCVSNPEPITPFFDFFVLGEAEEVLIEILQKVSLWKKTPGYRKELLEKLRCVQGVYVPEFFTPHFDKDGLLTATEPLYPDYKQVKKALVSDLDTLSPLPTKPLVPYMKIVHDRLNLEIARGCTRGCRFCQAGMIYRPVRERDPGKLLPVADKALRNTGFEEMSLLSLSSGDYSNIEPLLGRLMSNHCDERVSIALPSLRVGTLSHELIDNIRQVRKTGFTLAPEAGTERLRKVINKEISSEELLKISTLIYDHGWKLIKLYFMMGLPTETWEDLEELVELSHKVWAISGRQNPKGRVNIAVSTFVPKPHTPFQWSAQISLEQMLKNIDFFKKRLDKRGMRFKWHNPEQSFMEAILARGDRRIGEVIHRSWQMGARFDGWTEQFNYSLWQKAFESSKLPGHLWKTGKLSLDDPLPWDHLHMGVDRRYLEEEYHRALNMEYTGDCRSGKCFKCGVCDFKEIQPVIREVGSILDGPKREKGGEEKREENYFYRLRFCKRGSARLLSHLEMAEVFSRACRRSQLPAAFSKGYNPHMRLSFWQALPLGFESNAEFMIIILEESLTREEICRKLNWELPVGIEVLRVDALQQNEKWPKECLVTYEVSRSEKQWPQESIKEFFENSKLVERKTKKGRIRVFDLKDFVENISMRDEKTIELVLRQTLDGGPNLLEIISAIFGDSFASLPDLNVFKINVQPFNGEDTWPLS